MVSLCHSRRFSPFHRWLLVGWLPVPANLQVRFGFWHAFFGFTFNKRSVRHAFFGFTFNKKSVRHAFFGFTFNKKLVRHAFIGFTFNKKSVRHAFFVLHLIKSL